jgi:uncharacterized protein YcfJ
MAVILVVVAGGVVPSVHAQEAQAKPKAKTGQGALFGGMLGAVAGGIIGHDSGKTTEGVLIGGTVGALGGAAVGSQMKSKPAPAPVASQPAAASAQAAGTAVKVTMKQVIYWTEQGLPDDEIISRINKTGSVFVLTDDDVDYLRGQYVSERVIETMQDASFSVEK